MQIEVLSRSDFIEGSNVNCLDVVHFLELLYHVIDGNFILNHTPENQLLNSVSDLLLFALPPAKPIHLNPVRNAALQLSQVRFQGFGLDIQYYQRFLTGLALSTLFAFLLLWLLHLSIYRKIFLKVINISLTFEETMMFW